MKEGFENRFSEVQTDMVSICLEYIEEKGDKIFIYASYEAKTMSCDFFFDVDGKLYRKNELPQNYDISAERQMSCLDIILDDLEELISVCSEYEADMPTEIKIVYDIKSNKLNAEYQYDTVYSNTDKSADDVVESWYKEMCSAYL